MRPLTTLMAVIGLATSLGAQTDLVGAYTPQQTLVAFQQIGPAQWVSDPNGGVPVLQGEITTDSGDRVPYSVLLMMCDEARANCANLHIRHDHLADKDRLFALIDQWKATSRSPWAGYAFDRVRLIEDVFRYQGGAGQNAFVIALLWRDNLAAFHDMTQKR